MVLIKAMRGISIIAYQTAYLKTYHPEEFFAASMSTELSNQKLGEFCKRSKD